jgi:hypothetical protein
MPLAEDNDLIKAFASDQADQPVRVSIPLWRSSCGRSLTNPHRAKTPFEYLAIDAIANEISRRPSPATSFGELSGDPLSRRMLRHAQP